MKHVVVTGGSRGIGFGLVNEFLRSGCMVTFTATSDATLNRALDLLVEKWDNSRMRGVVCDVTRIRDLNTLRDFATKIFGPVDIWINNAGITNEERMFGELDPDNFTRIIDTNVKGVMLASHLAYNMMKDQGGGFIYNMGGLGSDGRMRKGLTPYGTSKRAVQYFTRALSREAEGGPVKVGLLLPGMVITDLVIDPIKKDPAGSRRFIRILNIMAEEVGPVTEFLVDRIMINTSNGATISFLSTAKMVKRFAAAPFVRRDIVSKYL
ncbi:MAG TPA: SDR family oxidoreductase [Bacteroidales bacterium]|nr:SDR family oxidoreductase [Bacteroidales bacterium]